MFRRIVNDTCEARSHVKVADTLMAALRVEFEFFYDFADSCWTTDGGASYNPGTITSDIADNRVPSLAEPVLNSRIQNLVSDWIPAVRKYEFARKWEIGGD